MLNGILRDGVRRRELWAWAMYDFANSGYTTVVITALFGAYFVAVVAGHAPWATFAWTAALAVSHLLVVASAPLVGAYADRRAARKRLLAVSTAGCVLFTALLYFARPELIWLAVLCLVTSSFFFGTGENLIAAFLPELATRRALGRVSGWGWGFGYLGGLFSLGLCLGYVVWAEARGQDATAFVPVTMLITAALFALASLPTFLLLRERGTPRTMAPLAPSPRAAWREVGQTLRQLRQFTDLARFLLCNLCYQAGIAAVVALAAIYASQAMGFSIRDTLLLIFAVNITAALGALLFGHVQDRIGHVRAIALILAGWLVAILLAWAAPAWPGGTALFWAAANLIGLCMGAAQSAGRALVGLLAPPSRLAEFYGFWGLSGKLAAIAGPMTYGMATWASGGDHRSALLLTGTYFIAGLLLLPGVNIVRGRRAALRAARHDALTSTP